jgi:predicted dienelactone hydrolase
MPIIYLRHPVHGTKVANMELEAEADAQNGWVVYNPDTPAKTEVKTEVVAEAAPVNTLDVKRRRKE